MPVRVDIPTRVRVNPDTLVSERDLLVEGLTAAVGRALERSHGVVLDKRGGYVGVRVHPLDVSWSGAGLAGISDSTRVEFEALLARVVSEAAEASTIFDAARAAEDAATPLATEPHEELDAERFSSLSALYALPSYEDGEETAVTVITFEPEDVASIQIDWQTIESDEELHAAFDEEIFIQGISIPSSGYIGAIFKWRDGKIYIRVAALPQNTLHAEGDVSGLHQLVLRGTGKDARFVAEPATLPPDASYRLRWYADGLTEEQRLQVQRDYWRGYIESTIRREAQRFTDLLSAAEFEQVLQERVEGVISQLPPVPDSTRSFCILSVNGSPRLIYTPLELSADLDTLLVPLVHTVTRRPVHEGKGRKGRGRGLGDGRGEGEVARRSGTEREPGGFVYTGSDEEPSDEPAPRYPPSRYTRGGTIDCSPFLNEPSLEQLGTDGDDLRRMIEEIAFKLSIPPCEHAGRFCISAAQAIGSRAATVAEAALDQPGFTSPVGDGHGNLGMLQFAPTASPAIQFMRHLATIVPLIGRLSDEVRSVLKKPEHAAKIEGHRRNDPLGWSLQLLIEMADEMNRSIGFILFPQTCRVLMLQLLRASSTGINARISNFESYAPLFELLVLTQLVSIDELRRLRRDLRDAMPSENVLADVGQVTVSTWRVARQGIIDVFGGNNPFGGDMSGKPGEIVRQDGVPAGIHDDMGRMWTLQDLDSAIAMREGTAQAIDPLVNQLISTPGTIARFSRDRGAIRDELRKLLQEMATNNTEITNKVTSSRMYAFRASKISESLPAATIPGTGYALQGLHLQAHEQIGEFFRGSPYYSTAIKAMFGSELGAESLLTFFEFTGTILLAVICPPLAVGVGIGLATAHHQSALEREQVYESLIDPDLVLSRSEVEAELFAAELVLALSFIPGVRSVLRTGTVTVRSVARHGLRSGARVTTRFVRLRVTQSMVSSLKDGVVVALARELIEDQVEDLIIGKLLIEPAIEQLQREFAAGEGQVAGGED